MTKTDKTTKLNAEVKFFHQKQVYSELDFAHSNSSFALEHCYLKISKRSNPLSESPYNKTREGLNGYLRDKQAGNTEWSTIYQNASTNITRDAPGYDTIAYNKNQEEEASYDQLHQDANET